MHPSSTISVKSTSTCVWHTRGKQTLHGNGSSYSMYLSLHCADTMYAVRT